jgi:hypothetical protein
VKPCRNTDRHDVDAAQTPEIGDWTGTPGQEEEMRGMAPAEDVERNVAKENAVKDRVTVALIAKAADDLKRTVDRSGLSKTDVINRSISLYEFIDRRLAAGDDLILRNKETGELERIVFW